MDINKEEKKKSWADIQDESEETLQKEKNAYSNECQKQK